MQKWAFYILIVLSFWSWRGWSQPENLSNLRMREVRPQSDSLQLDSLFPIPASIEVLDLQTQRTLDSRFYALSGKFIHWRFPPGYTPSKLRITYRVLPYRLEAPLSGMDTNQIRAPDDSSGIGLEYRPFAATTDPLIDFRGLEYNGSFSRGLSFGNSQDLVLNSRFNLQLAGDLGEGVQIKAALTDENIPLQPQGNTRQLQEFDQVFIELSKDDNRLVAGDYELSPPDSYFLNFFKKLQGATFSNTSAPGSNQLQTQASIAIARGQLARQNIEALEGNQGPYKLRGNNGERFIIVLSGTEKVWIDGQRLVRGRDADYIIDYNRAELTFTSRQLITKDRRIVLEFEYATQSFNRSLYALRSEYRHEGGRFYVNLISEQDGRNLAGNESLTSAQRLALQQAGDQPALVPSLDTLETFSEQQAAYRQIDTLLACGRRDTILVFTTDPERAQFTARFSFVGPGNGNYELDESAGANERVYRWTAPDPLTCRSRGAYAPLIQLTPPQQQRMITAGAEGQFDQRSGYRAEVSFSQLDQNRFSEVGAANDQGVAAYSELYRNFPINEQWALNTRVNYEFVQRNFQTFSPYRNPEFLRNWSLADRQGAGAVDPANEHLYGLHIDLTRQSVGEWSYRMHAFQRDGRYRGWRHEATIRMDVAGLAVEGQGSWLQAENEGRRDRFVRPRLRLTKTLAAIGNWQLGAYGELEKNQRLNTAKDTLSAGSFHYRLHRFFVKSPADQPLQLEAAYSNRLDFAPRSEGFTANTRAQEIELSGNWRAGKALRVGGNFTYRQLSVTDSSLTAQQPKRTLLGRTDLGLTLWKGALRSSTTYELGTGQEPKLEFTYVRVNKGEGTHIWLDSLFNQDGVIQPNEMEPAPFPDIADFVQVTTFTDDFIQSNFVNVNQSLQLNPKAVWFGAAGIKGFLSRFSSQSSLKVNRKTRENAAISAWNPFQLEVADTALVALQSGIRNILFFNRADPGYDIQLGATSNTNKFVQTTGFESRQRKEQFLKGRVNLSDGWSSRLTLSRGQRTNDSEQFNNKDYDIRFWSLEPQLTFLPNRRFRTAFNYVFESQLNVLPAEGEAALRHELELEATFNQAGNTSLQSSFSLVRVNFEGRPNSPAGFAMLNGLQPGRNYLWQLTLDRQLANGLRLRIGYEGRKTGTNRIVNVGRAQVAATF